MADVRTTSSSAVRWGPLWGARARDWVLSEEQQIPSYEAALAHVGLGESQLVLDVGCGAGTFLRLVADRGARPVGLDASEALIELARTRVP
jgi:cyclopropane fatty-acyl-phospholipid synthase-like methyltransferase